MTIDPAIRAEWHQTHALSPLSCHWLRVHNPTLAHPITAAVTELRIPQPDPATRP